MHGGGAAPKRRRAHWPTVADRVAAVHKLYPEWTQVQIAEHLGVYRGQVSRAAAELGIELPKVWGKKLMRLRDFHRHHPDWTAAQLAHAIGTNVEYVNNTARRLDLDILRAPRGRRSPHIPIPAWVPIHMHGDYRELALSHGEEAAASWARKAKREGRAA